MEFCRFFFQLWPGAQDFVVSLLGLKSAEGIKQNTIGQIPSSQAC